MIVVLVTLGQVYILRKINTISSFFSHKIKKKWRKNIFLPFGANYLFKPSVNNTFALKCEISFTFSKNIGQVPFFARLQLFLHVILYSNRYRILSKRDYY